MHNKFCGMLCLLFRKLWERLMKTYSVLREIMLYMIIFVIVLGIIDRHVSGFVKSARGGKNINYLSFYACLSYHKWHAFYLFLMFLFLGQLLQKDV